MVSSQVDSVMSKLAIERRVQYGAEKMLDVSRRLVSWGSVDREMIEG